MLPTAGVVRKISKYIYTHIKAIKMQELWLAALRKVSNTESEDAIIVKERS